MELKNESDWVLIGKMDVDAGLCLIGDPCYYSENNPMVDWGDFVNSINFKELVTKIPHTNGHDGRGVVVSTGYGDGTYSVYAQMSDSKDGWGRRLRRVMVDFDPVDEEIEEI